MGTDRRLVEARFAAIERMLASVRGPASLVTLQCRPRYLELWTWNCSSI